MGPHSTEDDNEDDDIGGIVGRVPRFNVTNNNKCVDDNVNNVKWRCQQTVEWQIQKTKTKYIIEKIYKYFDIIVVVVVCFARIRINILICHHFYYCWIDAAAATVFIVCDSKRAHKVIIEFLSFISLKNAAR